MKSLRDTVDGEVKLTEDQILEYSSMENSSRGETTNVIGRNPGSVVTWKPRGKKNVLGREWFNYVVNFREFEQDKDRTDNRVWHLRDFW